MKLKAVNKNKEFLRAYRRGAGYVGSLVVVYVVKNRDGFARFGVPSSKKIGNAVKRNRARRLLRASVRGLNIDMTQSVDIILVPRGKTPYVKQQQVQAQLKTLLDKAGIKYNDEENLYIAD